MWGTEKIRGNRGMSFQLCDNQVKLCMSLTVLNTIFSNCEEKPIKVSPLEVWNFLGLTTQLLKVTQL